MTAPHPVERTNGQQEKQRFCVDRRIEQCERERREKQNGRSRVRLAHLKHGQPIEQRDGAGK
jgi:hypothetical protein